MGVSGYLRMGVRVRVPRDVRAIAVPEAVPFQYRFEG